MHAAGESARLVPTLPTDTHAVVLHAPDEPALLALEQRLMQHDIAFRAIREPDPPFHNALMALGVSPCDRRLIRRFVSNLPLAR